VIIHDWDAARQIMSHKLIRNCHPNYRLTIAWRYLTLAGLPLATALRCLSRGFTSPAEAAFAGVIGKRERKRMWAAKERYWKEHDDGVTNASEITEKEMPTCPTTQN
jgi:hypothetical protein